ncbi:hypothetical protein [Gluconobacter japonicus]|uniref:hypothetical protein n=1 Tax=Gluconobacter japonicus TaxID=376620 RepID=UPI0007818696|nr:hypothetical protein [Gluconobacter japonicus]KXV26737.1 hypothetical protein AD937_06655 [Gluconobacter japonicus]
MRIKCQVLEIITGVKNDKRPLVELLQFLRGHSNELATQPPSFREPFIHSLRRVGKIEATEHDFDAVAPFVFYLVIFDRLSAGSPP